MLTVQFDKVKETERHLNGEVDASTLAGLDDLISSRQLFVNGPVSYDFRLCRISEMISISGHVSAEFSLACGRCLEPFVLPVEGSFDLMYAKQLPEVEVAFDEEIELTAEDLGIVLIPGEEIDLSEALVEQLLLCLPLQALCRKSCKGLCPQCGVDLNQSGCNCAAPQFDTRFSALKNLKIDSEQ